MRHDGELAARHAPRRNAFLAAAARAVGGTFEVDAAAARAVGGTFEVDLDDPGFQARDWGARDGVRLDWAPLQGVFPESALAAEWY